MRDLRGGHQFPQTRFVWLWSFSRNQDQRDPAAKKTGEVSNDIKHQVLPANAQVEKLVERQVEVPQIQYVDEVVDVPMVKHRHVPTVVKQQKEWGSVGGVERNVFFYFIFFFLLTQGVCFFLEMARKSQSLEF